MLPSLISNHLLRNNVAAPDSQTQIACISQTSIIILTYAHPIIHTEVQKFTVEENHLQATINILKLVSNKLYTVYRPTSGKQLKVANSGSTPLVRAINSKRKLKITRKVLC